MTGGCATLPSLPPTPIVMQPICQAPPAPTPLTLLPTPFQLVHDTQGVYWIALDPIGYEHLARNVEAMRLALNAARTMIAYYEQCTGGARGGPDPTTAGRRPDAGHGDHAEPADAG